MRVRYRKSPAGYAWALVEPIAYVAALDTMFTVIGSHPAFGNNMAIFCDRRSAFSSVSKSW